MKHTLSRRSFMGALALGAVVPPTWAAKARRPNVLLIMADDLGYHDLGCQGAKDLKTPHIDRLAASGIRFEAGYVTAPQCAPSRAGLMTGMHQARFGCLDNKQQFGLPPQSVVRTLPEQLKEEGYATGIIGKWHIGCLEKEREGDGTRPGNHPWERGFDYSLTLSGGMSHYFPYRMEGSKWMTDRLSEPRLRQRLEGEPQPAYLEGLPKDTYLTDIFSDKGADFVRRHAGKPWFLFLAYNAPHGPTMAPKDKMEKYGHIADRRRRVLAAMMESLDDGVGRVLRALDETGQTKDTLVCFLSDNGAPPENGSRNDPFSGRKGDVFEGGIRVPFLLAWPGAIPGGRVIPEPVTSLDILPTALAVAGREKVSGIHDGRNLLPWLKGDGAYPKKALYWSWRNNFRAVQMDSLKETRNGRDGKTVDGLTIPRHNVVDLSENPRELGGACTVQDPEKRALLSKHLDQWLQQVKEDAAKLTPK